MSQTNIITVKMYGLEATGSPSQIAELKKLLDEQNPIKIKFIPQTQPYIQPLPWMVQPYVYPHQPYITYDKTTVSPNTWKQDFYCTTTNDQNCIASNGSHVQNLHLTN
jgi:hypothetical protein